MSDRLSTILPDNKGLDFAFDYELGVWVAIFGDETDVDLAGSWFRHIGFCLGVIHGGLLTANPLKLVKLASLTNPDFTEDYYVDVNDEWLLKRYNGWTIECPAYQLLGFELIVLLCNLALALTYRILLEMAPEAVTSSIL